MNKKILTNSLKLFLKTISCILPYIILLFLVNRFLTDYGENLNNIIVEYSGFSEAFYANQHAVFLPGFFAFYPQPGYNMVFSTKEYKYVSAPSEPSYFKVSVSSNLKLTSNLDGDGVDFEGKSQNLTLVGGYFEENKINNYDVVVYPLDIFMPDTVDQILSKEYQNQFDKAKKILAETQNVDFSGKKIINIPGSLSFNSVLRTAYIYEDSVIISPLDLAGDVYEIFNSFVPEMDGKQDLRRSFFINVSNASKDIDLHLMDAYDSQSKFKEIHNTLVLKFQELGVEYVAPKVYKYLKDESNTTDELEFLKSIQ